MKYQHDILSAIHLLVFVLLMPFCRNRAISIAGFLFMMLFVGFNMVSYYLIKGNLEYVIKWTPIFIIPLIFTYIIRDLNFRYNKEKYNGFRLYLLIIKTDLKYVIGSFLISYYINLFFNPISGLLNYVNLTVVVALLVSIFICKKINRLERKTSKL